MRALPPCRAIARPEALARQRRRAGDGQHRHGHEGPSPPEGRCHERKGEPGEQRTGRRARLLGAETRAATPALERPVEQQADRGEAVALPTPPMASRAISISADRAKAAIARLHVTVSAQVRNRPRAGPMRSISRPARAALDAAAM